jgi:hypothetical protein
MLYLPAPVTEALRGSVNLGLYWRLGTEPALHLWMGFNDVPIGIPSLDAEGTVYLGAGKLMNIPELEVLINGIADRTEFYLSGVSIEASNIVDEEAPPVTGAPVHVGIAVLNDRYQPTTPIIPLWTGTADYWTMKQSRTEKATDTPTRTIAISVGTGDTTRSRPRFGFWTDAQQRIISSTDAFCDRVARYSRGYQVTWPRWS